MYGDGSPGTFISGTPVEQMGGQWSLAAYNRSILGQCFLGSVLGMVHKRVS